MKKFALFLVAVIGSGLLAANRPYDAMMKEANAACGSLKKNLEAKNSAAASADAKKLSAAFKEISQYWKTKKVTDASQWAKDASTASAEVVKALKSSKTEDAGAAFKKVTATCKPCHDAYREKGADGKWKVKGS